MSNPNQSKVKLKKYYNKQSQRNAIDFYSKGFLCSCNTREKDCIKEAYNILNEYVDKLNPTPNSEEVNLEEDGDISESLTNEISDLRELSSNSRRFKAKQSGAKNLVFVQTTVNNPVELAGAIMKDVYENGVQKTRFLLRLVPIETTCPATINVIAETFSKLAENHFKDEPQTFSIMFNHRNNNVIKRDDVIKAIADKVSEFRTDHKVDLKAAKITVIVEIIKGYAFLSIIPDYLKYKKFNLLSICSQEQEVSKE